MLYLKESHGVIGREGEGEGGGEGIFFINFSIPNLFIFERER